MTALSENFFFKILVMPWVKIYAKSREEVFYFILMPKNVTVRKNTKCY